MDELNTALLTPGLISARALPPARRRGWPVIRSLAEAVERREGIEGHYMRVANLASGLALLAGWGDEERGRLGTAALVYDVGKVAIPDAILLKPAALDPHEQAIMHRHSALGAAMVARVLDRPDEPQAGWVRAHHERFDGAGYPDGSAGEDIALGARLLGVADAFQAMISERVYRPALTRAEALAECDRQAGSRFCPDCVALLLRLRSERLPRRR